MKKLMESTWSPFQSPEVRDICEHLTPEEKHELTQLAREYGRRVAFRVGLPVFVIVMVFRYSVTTSLILIGLFIVYLLTFERLWIGAYQKRVREMLCATEYARSRGYQPETLRTRAFPWSK